MLRLRWSVFLFLALAGFPAGAPAADAPAQKKLYVTNSAGDDVTIVDPVSGKTLGRIEVGLHPHGIGAPADGRFILVSIEGTKPGQLVWIDPKTDKVTHHLNIGPAPNQLAVTPDGRIAYVPASDGNWEVIDTEKREIITRIFVGGRPHNTLCSSDGKRMYLAPMGSPHKVIIADTSTHKKLGEIPFSSVVRPIALTPDEKTLFAEVDGLVGIEAADLSTRKMIHRIPATLQPEQRKVASRSHGLGVRPDGKEVWECDVEHHEVHVYDLTGDKPTQIATVPVGERCYWLIFSPDGKTCYVSVRGRNEVVFIDTASKKVVERAKVGKEPKRLLYLGASGPRTTR
jgi:YVTN family beta-propeller protein